ncbi:MAG: hypothetical protein ACTSRS_15375 [Candidatus Helarchaeota archaeon]
MNYMKFLKWVILIGGFYEIIFGILLIFFIQPLLSILGVSNPEINFPIFNQTAGLLAITMGILLIATAFDIQRYLLIPLVSVGLRIAIQFIIFSNLTLIPEMTSGLVAFGVIDLVFGTLTLILIRKGISSNELTLDLFK